MAEVLAFDPLCHHNYSQGAMEKRTKKKNKSHEPSRSLRHGEGWGDFLCKAQRVQKQKAHLHMVASRSFRGADSRCSVSIFTARRRGRVPWPWKETQMRSSLALLIKIELLRRCCAITASDCSADKIDKDYFSFLLCHTGVIKLFCCLSGRSQRAGRRLLEGQKKNNREG